MIKSWKIYKFLFIRSSPALTVLSQNGCKIEIQVEDRTYSSFVLIWVIIDIAPKRMECDIIQRPMSEAVGQDVVAS